jgi:glycosyltransferase involved in cell wall biosynthesis
MIPTFNCAKYLKQTLESVLAQDFDPEQMQIEVVDDCSTKDDPETVVREIGKGRVAFYRKPKNEGAIANFNTCIERSCGHLVHILHGDDYVLPGFYEKLTEQAKINPDVTAFFVRCQIVDEDGSLNSISGRVSHLARPSRLPGDLLYSNDLMTPGVVVRRSHYETCGGFLSGLVHVADWEMWVRAIGNGGGLWLNELSAAYRFFPGNDTGRRARSAEHLRDCLRQCTIFAMHYNKFDLSRFKRDIANRALAQEKQFKLLGDKVAATANHRLWKDVTPRLQRWKWSLLNAVLSLRRKLAK